MHRRAGGDGLDQRPLPHQQPDHVGEVVQGRDYLRALERFLCLAHDQRRAGHAGPDPRSDDADDGTPRARPPMNVYTAMLLLSFVAIAIGLATIAYVFIVLKPQLKA